MKRTLAIAALFAFVSAQPSFAAGGPQNDDASKPQTRLTTAPTYVPLPAIVTATTIGRGVGGQLTVDLGLDVPNEKDRKRVFSMRPKIQDALRTAVADYAMIRFRAGGTPDPTALGAATQAAVDKVLGPNIAKVTLANVMAMSKR